MKTEIKNFLDEFRSEYKHSQEGTERLLKQARDEGEKEWKTKLNQINITRSNTTSDVLVALYDVGLITDEEEEEQSIIFEFNINAN